MAIEADDPRLVDEADRRLRSLMWALTYNTRHTRDRSRSLVLAAQALCARAQDERVVAETRRARQS
jgi:hypothetical protein